MFIKLELYSCSLHILYESFLVCVGNLAERKSDFFGAVSENIHCRLNGDGVNLTEEAVYKGKKS